MENPGILIVDDSPSAREIMRSLLAPIQPAITMAGDGLEGLRKAQTERFDMIVVDVDMPGMNGIELCKALKEDASCRDLPVVMVSTFDSDKAIRNGFAAGAEAYVSKYEIDPELLKTVQMVLEKAAFHRERTVLLVDDSPSTRQLVAGGLSRAGFQVTYAENMESALEKLHGIRPDLILGDIDMPGMDGLRFCKLLKSKREFETIPLVVMSTNKDRATLKRMVQHGAAAYIVKPFHLDQLVLMIEKLVSDQFVLLCKEKEHVETEHGLILGAIGSLISALEARDPYTRGHSDAVSSILSEMVALTGAPAGDVERAAIGGKLHDIGKIGVQDKVLLKPGKLTDAEFAEIKRHPVTGKNILAPITSLSEIIPIVFLHHERWDGTGYPTGLKGLEIPLWARLTAVADTYHALTSNRPYRKSLPMEKALDIIRGESGKQLCPESVAIFFTWLESGVARVGGGTVN